MLRALRRRKEDNVNELEFNSHGHFLRQIWRQEDIAIYERSRAKDNESHELELVHCSS